MFLGVSIAGYSSTTNGNFRLLNSPDINNPISSFSINGGVDGVIVDKLYGSKSIITEKQFYEIEEYNPSYDENSYLFADFNIGVNDDIFAGSSITQKDGSVSGFTLHKIFTNGSGALEDVVVASNIKYNDFLFNDYMNVYGGRYYLTINGSSETSLSPTGSFTWSANTNVSNEIKSSPWGYFLIDTEKSESYFFDYNLNIGGEQTAILCQQFSKNEKFDTFFKGSVQYQRGDFSGISHDSSTKDLSSSNRAHLEKLKEFIYSDRNKILKTRRGDVYSVVITQYSESPINPTLKDCALVSSISWAEIGERKNDRKQ